jgi:hypothetical protein
MPFNLELQNALLGTSTYLEAQNLRLENKTTVIKEMKTTRQR